MNDLTSRLQHAADCQRPLITLRFAGFPSSERRRFVECVTCGAAASEPATHLRETP